ncbi:DUF3289 family protein [Tenacibaculum ovolyticum]|uniref:DUF3289 family protein n=1 Tax=Tenacibaculum ovolyticum TaxID=104270 RepID=UPI0022F3FAAF|nr:DUF3289 family protein [Tenacibaculum ovolyticum]WBX77464.1 DUF3289 family protein [Tenacibaculum ovolyticum]
MNKAVQTNTPDKKIEKSATDANLWLEVTTLNVLPGEEVLIELEDEDTEKEIQKGEKKLASATCIDPSGKGILLLNSKKEITSNNIAANEEVLDNNETNEASGILKEGKWTIDLEGTKPITRAVPGMLVYFHIKTSIPNGESVHIELYEDDNNEKEEKGTGDKDEHQPLVSSATKKPATHETVSNGKIIKTIQLDNLEKLIKNDVDKQIELYFRCSYKGTNVELPSKPKDYLVVGTLVVDRYKMPGLNASGTDIADDLTYGTGISQRKDISQELKSYKDEYATSGFNEEKHGLFTNKKGSPSIITLKETNEYQKAKYSKKEIYDVKTKSGYDSGSDIKNFNEEKSPITGKWRDDNYLFWNFKNTAELYFARGELQTNLDRMIAKFKSNTGGIYEYTILNKHVNNHPNTDEYCLSIEDYLAERFKQDFKTSIAEIEDKEPYFFKEGKLSNSKFNRKDTGKFDFSRPKYSYDKGLWDASKGLTIALNDIWSTEVILTQLKNKDEEYTCKYQITLWDHFGLDLPDMKRKFNTYFSVKEAFICWFVLQHLRGYKPFVTKITFEREFKGNFNIGRKERLDKRIKEAAIKKADKEKMERLRQIGRKKPGEM